MEGRMEGKRTRRRRRVGMIDDLREGFLKSELAGGVRHPDGRALLMYWLKTAVERERNSG